ncbi:hypothetical protein PR202_gb24258 [Eleusine coracana subsp. coracana]|uniref:Methyltransferase domain-containing protein n=1 Tax=Eleusine coracana subsp. coracana TaxID=191504 RepID=A0AAV5FKM0_ELECO|nr:hypothetical protein PR202_gb24258 [Eleusine coracana subsp. coracana]
MAATPASSGGAYSCDTAAQTREWMDVLADFIRRHRPLLEAHVVNFFKDRLWEMVDAEWMDCLRREPVESLLKLPSGCVQEHWPRTLQEFVLTARSLVLPRVQKSPDSVGSLNLSDSLVDNQIQYMRLRFLLIPDLHVASIGTVLAQGMNLKKKHEIESLAAMVHAIAKSHGAKTVVDVGSGQGYLAQALSFEYRLPVVAIDASSHHASVTNARAERIKKHYAAKCVENQQLNVPRTVTCHVLSSDTLAAVTLDACKDDNGEHETKTCSDKKSQIQEPNHSCPPLILAGLHACGDLSVNMLSHSRNFLNHFQSAERWRSLTKDIAIQNFDIHAFRAAFQMVLEKFFPEISKLSPSIGRQGKALRRQKLQKVVESQMKKAENVSYSTLKEQNVNVDGVDTSIYGVESRPTDIYNDECRKFSLFRDYTISGFGRLGCGSVEDASLLEIWKGVLPFAVGLSKHPFLCHFVI